MSNNELSVVRHCGDRKSIKVLSLSKLDLLTVEVRSVIILLWFWSEG